MPVASVDVRNKREWAVDYGDDSLLLRYRSCVVSLRLRVVCVGWADSLCTSACLFGIEVGGLLWCRMN